MSAWTEKLASRTQDGRAFAANVAAATALLTRVPVVVRPDLVGAAAFGAIGALIGAAGGLVVILFAPVSAQVAAILAITVMTLLSGALHLDGLADTADALAAPDPDAAERARLDPRIGPAGLIAIVLVLGLEWTVVLALMDAIGAVAAAAGLVMATSIARSAAALTPVTGAPRPRPGFGSWFADRVTRRDAVLSIATTLAIAASLALVMGRPIFLAAAIVGVVGGVFWARILGRLRHGLDGDALGAIVELTSASTLLALLLAA